MRRNFLFCRLVTLVVYMMSGTRAIVRELWSSLGLPTHYVENYLNVTGDPSRTLPSSFNLGLVAQATIATSGLAAAYFNALNDENNMQVVIVDAKHAALEFRSETNYFIDSKPAEGVWDNLSGTYPTKDSSFVRIHTNFPHHKAGIISILGLPTGASREDVGDALLRWDSKKFEDEAANKGMCATAFRSFEEWTQHPHAHANANSSPIQLIKLDNAPKRRPRRPSYEKGALQGIRVLDLTRVIAGPVCGRTLAAHGADTLWITSPNLPSLPKLDSDTSRGKRTSQLDLSSVQGRQSLFTLAEDGDVFLQSYRPHSLGAKGFGPTNLSSLRPGIVYANLRAWGWDGPWRNRRGFDSLVQTATGFNFDEALAFGSYKGITQECVSPKPFPVQALDHAAGYLLTFGIVAALCKTMTEGGSWEVRVSLAAVGNWIRSLGRLGPTGFENTSIPYSLSDPEFRSFLEVLSIRGDTISDASISESNNLQKKTMLAVSHSAILERTPVLVKEAIIKLGIDHPVWLPKQF